MNQASLVSLKRVHLNGQVIAFHRSVIVKAMLFTDLNRKIGVALLQLIQLINLAVRLHNQGSVQKCGGINFRLCSSDLNISVVEVILLHVELFM